MIRKERDVRRRSVLSARGAKIRTRKTGWNKRVARRKSECRNNAKTKSFEGKRSVSRENGRKNGMTVEARMMIMTVIAGIGMMMIANHRRDDE